MTDPATNDPGTNDTKPTADAVDVVLPVAPTEDAAGARVLRMRNGELSAGEVRPVQEGKPYMGGEIVRLERRKDAPMLYDVKVQYEGPKAASTGPKGPAQVATSAYRDAWDRTFRPLPS